MSLPLIDTPNPVSRVIFYNELIKKPGSVIIQMISHVDENKDISNGFLGNNYISDGFLHKILDGKKDYYHPAIVIPGSKISVALGGINEMKKLLYWLEENSYSFGGTKKDVLDRNLGLMAVCLVGFTFELQDNFFDDIPDYVDGFKSL